MGKNRIAEFLRDPTLDQPTTDYFVVRLVMGSLTVTRETAARILAAAGGCDRTRLVRVETITGSVAYVRTDAVISVQESTRAQRAAMRRFWKALDDEEDEEDEFSPPGD